MRTSQTPSQNRHLLDTAVTSPLSVSESESCSPAVRQACQPAPGPSSLAFVPEMVRRARIQFTLALASSLQSPALPFPSHPLVGPYLTSAAANSLGGINAQLQIGASFPADNLTQHHAVSRIGTETHPLTRRPSAPSAVPPAIKLFRALNGLYQTACETIYTKILS